MSCLETYGTLRIFSPAMDPVAIGKILSLESTAARPRDPSASHRARREVNMWEWCTRHVIATADPQEHLREIVDFISPSSAGLSELQEIGCQTDIFFFWVSSGQGGPSLDVSTMQALVNLKLSICWDMYFGDEEDYKCNI